MLLAVVTSSEAQELAATKLQIRDASDPQKRQVLIQSRDSGVQ